MDVILDDAYSWGNEEGWRRFRVLRPGRGMYHDVRRRLPYYWSDFRDGLNYRTMAATVRMYFVNLLPALAFQLDMSYNTNGFYGINEALFSSALAAMVFSLLAAQPLTIVGVTGLISLFNYTTYDIIRLYDVTIYPRFMVWVSIWAAITHWLVAICNWCDYMRFVTDFSSETFGMYVGAIYISKGVEELRINFDNGNLPNGWASCVIAILYTLTVYLLDKMKNTVLFKRSIRSFLSEYAFPLATIFWTGFAHFPGNIENAEIEFLPITRAFYPTVDRSWLIDFWNLSAGWVFVALPFGILLTLLFYYDHNVSSLTAQAKQFPLKKPAGFHWDLFLLGCTSFVAGIIGLPLPNGLVPQAPVHTEALTESKDEVKIIHAQEPEGLEIRSKQIVPVSVVEQRVSHFLMGLALVGTMTGPLLKVLGTLPRAIICGVFFIVGWGSIEGNGITRKIIFLWKEQSYVQPHEPLLRLRKIRIAYYVFWQLFGVACTVAISQTIAAIGFPVLIVALIPFRWVLMPKMFTSEELEVMDSLTANNPVVLASLGGKPTMPEGRLKEGDGQALDTPSSERADEAQQRREDIEADTAKVRLERGDRGYPSQSREKMA